MKKKPSAYAAAGVDIDEMDRGLAKIKADVKSTKTPGVLSDIGRFGGLFRSRRTPTPPPPARSERPSPTASGPA